MSKVLRVSSVLMVCLVATFARAASPWDAQISELSRKIAVLTGNSPISFSLLNASSLSIDDVASIRRSLQDQLRSSGVQLRDGSPTIVRVTLSENIRGILWTAEVQQGPNSRVAIVTAPRVNTSNPLAAPLVLRRSFLFAQDEQILDAALWQGHDQRFLLLLSPSRVNFYRQNGSRWDSVGAYAIPHEAYPRDLRGRLWLGRDGDWKAFLPGIQCSGAAQLQPPMACHNSDDPWPIGEKAAAFFNSARNYFSGAMAPSLAKPLPPFYSAVQPRNGKNESWIYTGLDGEPMFFDGSVSRPLAGARDWGSDLAAVHSNCGSHTQVLASAAGDESATDSIRAFEIDEREARAVSPPLAFDGALTALWTNSEGDAAIAVLRTPAGSYESYSVSVACNQ